MWIAAAAVSPRSYRPRWITPDSVNLGRGASLDNQSQIAMRSAKTSRFGSIPTLQLSAAPRNLSDADALLSRFLLLRHFTAPQTFRIMANPNDPKYLLRNVVAGTALQRRDSLTGGGPLEASPVHWIVSALPSECTLLPNGDYTTTQHLMEHIFLDVLTWENALLLRNLSWYLPLTRGEAYSRHSKDATVDAVDVACSKTRVRVSEAGNSQSLLN